MSSHPSWDPDQYRRYADERSRPFFELVGRVGAEQAGRVVDLGCAVDAWETTYQHVLHGADPVLEWVKGTALRPVLSTLAGAERDAFVADYAARLREAYPARPFGTVMPFRRIFVVARRP